MQKQLILLFLLLLNFSIINSTHIIGGDLFYKCLGNNSYEITLKVYRDCDGGVAPFDPQAKVGIFDALTGNTITILQMVFPGSNPVPVNNPNGCYNLPPNLCVEVAEYVSTITLPPSANGYNIVYQRCCRNGSINNIVSPGTSGSTYTSFIPPSQTVCNSSPYFNNFPPVVLCINDALRFDHSATDEDGDSLVYEFAKPYMGGNTNNPAPNPTPPPFNTVNWAPGFSNTYQLATSPSINIDSKTGLITGTPNALGQYVIGIIVKEYRNGIYISETRRDFQFNIVNCNKTVSAILDQTIFCNDFTIQFDNNSFNSTSYSWDFGDTTIISDTSNAISPQYTYNDSGIYRVRLIANPNTVCADTAFSTFRIFPKLKALFTPPNNQCFKENSFNFTGLGNYYNTTIINWKFGLNGNPNNSSIINPTNIKFINSGTQIIKLTYSDFGCTDSITDSIFIIEEPKAEIVPDNNTYCANFPIQFQNNSLNGNEYLWDFGDTTVTTDTSSLFSPQYTYNSNAGIYNIRLIANPSQCPDTAYSTLQIFPKIDPIFTPPDNQCFSEHSFNFLANGDYYPTTNINWDFGINALTNSSNLKNPSNILFNTPGYQEISLTYSDFGCTKTFTDTILIYNSPVAKFNFDTNATCLKQPIQFIDSSLSDININRNWFFGDGNSSLNKNPKHFYGSDGIYSIKLVITDVNGCKDSLSKNEIITIFPLPTANFAPLEKRISLLESKINFTDLSLNTTNIIFNTGDNNIYNSTNIQHKYTDTGYFYTTQIAENNFGCYDTIKGSIYIRPNDLLYAPNTFTPNNDGINDIFKPIYLGKEYLLTIFNKWGAVIFESNNPNEGWNGKVKGNKYAKTDVYVYKINYTNFQNIRKSHIGHLNLLK